MRNGHRGLTLVELVSSLAIMGIVTGMVIPSLARMHARSEATAGINWIITAVNFTRHAAITRRTTATLCPADKASLECGGEWHDGLIVFADQNKNGKLDGRDYLIQRIQPENIEGTFKWRAFRNRQYLQLTSLGYTNYQNGNFVYCPLDQDLTLARQIVINVQGRARVIHRQDENGIRLDRKGKPLRC